MERTPFVRLHSGLARNENEEEVQSVILEKWHIEMLHALFNTWIFGRML